MDIIKYQTDYKINQINYTIICYDMHVKYLLYEAYRLFTHNNKCTVADTLQKKQLK